MNDDEEDEVEEAEERRLLGDDSERSLLTGLIRTESVQNFR